jgi:hypothetical protein
VRSHTLETEFETFCILSMSQRHFKTWSDLNSGMSLFDRVELVGSDLLGVFHFYKLLRNVLQLLAWAFHVFIPVPDRGISTPGASVGVVLCSKAADVLVCYGSGICNEICDF